MPICKNFSLKQTILLSMIAIGFLSVSTNSTQAQYYYTPLTPIRFYTQPYDFFNPNQTQPSIVNSYLLSQLSFKIYTMSLNESQLREDLEEIFEPQGLDVDYVFMNSWTGTEGAILSNDDSVFLVFRGTSAQGTPLYSIMADYVGDVDDDFKYVNIAGKYCYVHKGFWHNVDSEFGPIRQRILQAYQQGKKVFITGHSLGGANAAIAAIRLHYQYDINISGLQTFGAPKVGDINLKSLCQGPNKNGAELADMTQRWVFWGDPAPTFFDKELVWINKRWRWKYYEHFGKVNKIFAQNDGGYNVYFNTSEYTNYESLLGLQNEHNGYFDALKDVMIEQGYGYLVVGD